MSQLSMHTYKAYKSARYCTQDWALLKSPSASKVRAVLAHAHEKPPAPPPTHIDSCAALCRGMQFSIDS